MDLSNKSAAKDISKHDKEVLNRLFNPNLPYDEDNEDKSTDDIEKETETEEIVAVKKLEIEGMKLAEKGEINLAIEKFNQTIDLTPNRASCYNNRAQTYRLSGDTNSALTDLDKAIELSNGHGKAARQAYAQRGLIKKLIGQEGDALNDFKSAANLGSDFAKNQVIAMNPYSALCNKMLSEMMVKIRNGEA